MRRDEQRLQDILEAIAKIELFSGDGREAFDEDERTQVWMVHHIQIVDEAARALSEKLRAEHPEIPWDLIVGMRHILVPRLLRDRSGRGLGRGGAGLADAAGSDRGDPEVSTVKEERMRRVTLCRLIAVGFIALLGSLEARSLSITPLPTTCVDCRPCSTTADCGGNSLGLCTSSVSYPCYKAKTCVCR